MSVDQCRRLQDERRTLLRKCAALDASRASMNPWISSYKSEWSVDYDSGAADVDSSAATSGWSCKWRAWAQTNAPLQAAMTLPRPISSFYHYAPMSFELLCSHLRPGSFSAGSTFDTLITRYQDSVAQQVGVPPAHICLFFQYPFSEHFALSSSAGLYSPECSLSAVLASAATSTEALFLTLAHELLLSENDPSSPMPLHASLQASAPADPHPPDPSLMASLYMCHGVNRRCLVEHAVAEVRCGYGATGARLLQNLVPCMRSGSCSRSGQWELQSRI
jgi:hypothetical protein